MRKHLEQWVIYSVSLDNIALLTRFKTRVILETWSDKFNGNLKATYFSKRGTPAPMLKNYDPNRIDTIVLGEL